MRNRAPRFSVCTLESRLMLAGDLSSSIAEGDHVCESSVVVGKEDPATAAHGPSRVLVFVDERVAADEVLMAGVPASAELHLVGSGQDGIRVISDQLRDRQAVQSVHLIGHGSSGTLQLGKDAIDSESIQQSQVEIRRWKQSLDPTADILIYGCHVGAGTAGTDFVDLLSTLTGADVAASNDSTGPQALGGDWELEVTRGAIESRIVFSERTRDQFSGLLPITIDAAGETGEEAMDLIVDGKVVASWSGIGGDVEDREFESFVFETDGYIDPSRVEVAFVNDLYRPGEIDRNLMVDRIVIDGNEYQTEAGSVYSDGTHDPEMGFAPRFAYYEFLHKNGSFQFGQDPASKTEYRSLTGYGNNWNNPEWGSTGETLLRSSQVDYADGISEVGGEDRPSPRLISNELAAQEVHTGNERGLSTAVYVWGQFIDHDLSLSEAPPEQEGGSHNPYDASTRETLTIPVPQGDPYFDPYGTGEQVIETVRTEAAEGTGTSTDNPREQFNSISAYLDAGQVYGSNPETALSLRTFHGGQMKTSDGGLLPTDDDGQFSGGDIRANENVNLTAMHTLFVREHNRIAAELAANNADWGDDRIFEESRRLVVAQIQSITYEEFLPALLGDYSVGEYQGFDETVDPGINNEFANAGYRLGHTLVNDTVQLVLDDGTLAEDPLALADAFFAPQVLQENGIDTILKGMVSVQSEEIDNQIVGSLRNFLFGPPGAGGLDLASLNIARGRDHGLADYNSVRLAYGLDAVTSFEEISSDPEVQQKLKTLYGNVDDVDVWVGGLAEDHLHGSSLGQLMQAIVVDQFARVRDGDRFWYERDLNTEQLAFVQQSTLSEIIRRNTSMTNIQDDAMLMQASISGTVWVDASQHAGAGVMVGLYNTAEKLIATATTNQWGHYCFGNIGQTGIYHVAVEQMVERYSDFQTASAHISRGGMNLESVDLKLV